MKANQKLILAAGIVAAGAMEQVFREGFQPFVQEQQKAAKSGLFTVLNDGIPEAVLPLEVEPLRTTVGSLVVLANREVESPTLAVIKITNNLANRKVVFSNADDFTSCFSAANTVANTDYAGSLTFDGGEKNSAPLTNGIANGTGLSTQINAMIATRKPSFTVSSLINGIEDIVLEDGTKDALVFVNQFGNVISVLTGPPANIATAYDDVLINLSALNTEVGQNATPPASTGVLLGE